MIGILEEKYVHEEPERGLQGCGSQYIQRTDKIVCKDILCKKELRKTDFSVFMRNKYCR